MSQRMMLMTAAAITAFVLVVVGGLAGRLVPAAEPAPAAVATLTPTADSPDIAAYQQREAAYQQALAEANRRLELANQQLAGQAGASAATAADAQVSAEQAAQVAVTYRGGGQVREVDAEHEHGVAVFEVKFTDGAKVYVDAATGQVAYAEREQ